MGSYRKRERGHQGNGAVHAEAAGEEGSERSSKRLRHSADIHASSVTTHTLADVSQQVSGNSAHRGPICKLPRHDHIINTGAYYLAMIIL